MRKDMRPVEISISSYEIEGPIETIEERVRRVIGKAECLNPVLDVSGWDGNEWYVRGERHATPKEIERAEKASAAAKQRNQEKKARAEALERLQYEKLKKKFEESSV